MGGCATMHRLLYTRAGHIGITDRYFKPWILHYKEIERKRERERDAQKGLQDEETHNNWKKKQGFYGAGAMRMQTSWYRLKCLLRMFHTRYIDSRTHEATNIRAIRVTAATNDASMTLRNLVCSSRVSFFFPTTQSTFLQHWSRSLSLFLYFSSPSFFFYIYYLSSAEQLSFPSVRANTEQSFAKHIPFSQQARNIKILRFLRCLQRHCARCKTWQSMHNTALPSKSLLSVKLIKHYRNEDRYRHLPGQTGCWLIREIPIILYIFIYEVRKYSTNICPVRLVELQLFAAPR